MLPSPPLPLSYGRPGARDGGGRKCRLAQVVAEGERGAGAWPAFINAKYWILKIKGSHCSQCVFMFSLGLLFEQEKGWRCRLQKLKDTRPFCNPPGWNEYIPKKIDTQKVYRSNPAQPKMGPATKTKPAAGSMQGEGDPKSVQHPVFPSGRPPQY